MANDIYLQQILRYFRNNFIEGNSATEEDLSQLIREKLVLIEDQDERKNLITRTLDEIQEIILIYKYRQIYQQKAQITLPAFEKRIVHHLNYCFRRNLYE